MSQHETDILIKMTMPVASFRELAKNEPIKAAESLDLELKDFEGWMAQRGMEPLSRPERQILKEYLGFKLVT